MTRWKLILIGAAFAATAVVLILVSWVNHRELQRSASWPRATALIIGQREIYVFRGRATVVRGQHAMNDKTYDFELLWGRNPWQDGRFVPPADTPPVGSTVVIRYNPANPHEAALPAQSAEPFMSPLHLLVVSLLSLLALICWFVRP
ncbi:DUF3592 domain-containing protein [Sorangium sp. So ce429]